MRPTSERFVPSDELRELIAATWNGDIAPDGQRRLEQLLLHDEAAQEFYISCMAMHSQLLWQYGNRVNVETQAFSEREQPPAVFSLLGGEWQETTERLFDCFQSHPIQFSYLVATVVFGLILLVASHIYVSTHSTEKLDGIAAERQPAHIDRKNENDAKLVPSVASASKSVIVGHIAAAVHCELADRRSAEIGSPVMIGGRYVLKSGLVKIVYDAGAQVLLQGPCSYQVESATSGFLKIGKITVNLDKQGNGNQHSTDGTKPTAAEPKNGVPHAMPENGTQSQDALFAVRTPTAIVSDLGTEFGVDVTDRGVTTSHVFRGLVELRALAVDGKPNGVPQLLRANQSARVEEIAEVRGTAESQSPSVHRRVVVVALSDMSLHFVREIPKKTKTLDLVDVVAGGDGFSGRRNAGIDPTNGQRSNAVEFGDNPAMVKVWPLGDRKYHRAHGMPLIDGVFIPDGSRGPMQVDSAGHLFADCPATANRTPQRIWSGGRIPAARAKIPTVLKGVDFGAKGHGLLSMHANNGITFDLDAIRKANPGWNVQRFLAVVGNVQQDDISVADFWVLVDGEVRDRRRQFHTSDLSFYVAISINPKDRFLTLISTDGGNGILGDFVIFGDPRLEMTAIDAQCDLKKPAEKERL